MRGSMTHGRSKRFTVARPACPDPCPVGHRSSGTGANRGTLEPPEDRPGMQISVKAFGALAVLAAAVHPASGQKTIEIPLDRLDQQQALNVKTDVETYKGLKSLRVVDSAPPDATDGIQLVVLNNTSFGDGT